MASSILNSDDGVISGTSGLKSTGGDDGVLNIQNNGTTAVTVNASGNVGVGTSSPNRKLEVMGGAGADTAMIRSSYSVDATYYREFGRNNSNGAFEIRRAQGGAATTDFAIDVSGNLQFNSGYGSVATAYGCRAWVNFNGTGTPAIREDGNVSSITDNATGQYTVNFTTAMPDANYCANITCSSDATAPIAANIDGTNTAMTTTSCGVVAFNSTNAATLDRTVVNVSIFR